jgi:ABC-type antimicrobial peptide transport system permease subunit
MREGSRAARYGVMLASRITAYGAALGLGGAVVLVRIIDSLLFRTPPFDPVNFVAAAVVLFGVALIASYLPARRAALTDPVHALRAE